MMHRKRAAFESKKRPVFTGRNNSRTEIPDFETHVNTALYLARFSISGYLMACRR